MVETMTDEERARLQNAVARAEKRTSAEIVVMVMRDVTDYRVVELMAAAVVAMAVPALLLPFTAIPALWIWLTQLGVFVLLATALPLSGIGRRLVGKDRLSRDVEAAARAEFFAHGLRRSTHRAAILVFVAIREHRVHVLYDDAAEGLVTDTAWRALADQVAAKMKAGEMIGGLEAAVEEIADLLEPQLPPQDGDADELPNVIVR